MDDESSSHPFAKPNFHTPATNKRLRSDSDEPDVIYTQTNLHQNNIQNIDASKRQMTSSTQHDFPPITLEFSVKHDKSDRELIEELIKEWKLKNNKEINIIGRFGFKHVLLIFARDLSTLDDLLSKPQWPIRINNMEFKLKFPTRLPNSYSLVIRDFQSSWKEVEITEDLREAHSSLLKLTRLVARNGKPLNVVRADFASSMDVKQLLDIGEINLNHMKLQVRPYFSPIRINKCRKCFKHDHNAAQCTSKQLCIRCGQHHSFENECRNEIKCVNCQQPHYSGHSSCPVVQQKRKIIADEQKMHRVQMLMQQQQSFEYNKEAFPTLSPQLNNRSTHTYVEATLNGNYINNNPSYASVAAFKTKNNSENVEQMLLAISNSINRQLSNISATLTSQITELATKIDRHKQKSDDLQYQIQKAIIPAIQGLAKAIDDLSQQKHLNHTQQSQQQPNTTSSCSEMIQCALMNCQESNCNSPGPKSRRQRHYVTHKQINVLN